MNTINPKKLPLVSVLMPAYNHEQYIAQAIESIWIQTYENIELIVVDDGSSDHSYQTALKMLKISPIPMQVYKNENNRGLCGSLNRLQKIANGDYLMFHADDDISVPEKIQKMVDVIEGDSSIVGVHSSLREMDLNGKLGALRIHKRFNRILSSENISESILNINRMSVVTQSHLFRRIVFDYFGDFDGNCTHEAKALLFREIFLGKLVYISKELTYYRVGSGTSTQDFSESIVKIIDHSRKVNRWNYSALENIKKDLKTIRKDVRLGYWVYLRMVVFYSTFKYRLRDKILNQYSFLHFIFALLILDKVSIGHALKIFFPNFYLKLMKGKILS